MLFLVHCILTDVSNATRFPSLWHKKQHQTVGLYMFNILNFIQVSGSKWTSWVEGPGNAYNKVFAWIGCTDTGLRFAICCLIGGRVETQRLTTRCLSVFTVMSKKGLPNSKKLRTTLIQTRTSMMEILYIFFKIS